MDDDKSGTDFSRFDDIRERARKKEIDVIVFKNSARLGRNQKEALGFVEYLEEQNVEIIFEDEQYNEEMFGLYAWFNERRARDDSKNIRRNLRHKDLIKEINVGDTILVNNGLLIFEVKKLQGNDAICEVKVGGEMSDRKSMNFPNHVLKGDFLSEQDKSDLLFGIKNDVDFVAASFVSTKSDIKSMRDFLDENGGADIDIIAKIENRAGVDV